MAQYTSPATVSVLIPTGAVRDGTLPQICALTGATNTLPWKRSLGNWEKGYLPIREDLVRQYSSRLRMGVWWLCGFLAAWGVATVLALVISRSPQTGNTAGPIAVCLFLGGLAAVLVAIIYLTLLVGTIPLRTRVVRGSDGQMYLKVANANPSFAAALTSRDPAPATGAPLPEPADRGTVAPPSVRARLVTHPTVALMVVVVWAIIWISILARAGRTGWGPIVAEFALLAIAIALVAVAFYLKPRLGTFVFSPAKAVAMVGVGGLAGAFGLIESISSAHPAVLSVGAAWAICAMVAFVVVGAAYSNLSAHL